MRFANSVLQESVTVSATGSTNGPWLDLGHVENSKPNNAVVLLTAGTAVTNDTTVIWQIEASADGATSEGAIAAVYDGTAAEMSSAGFTIVAGAAAVSRKLNIVFSTPHRFVRLSAVVAAAGGTRSIQYESWISPNEDGKI